MRIFRLPLFTGNSGLFHATFPKECGSISYKDGVLQYSQLLKNNMKMITGINPENYVGCEQVHETAISTLREIDSLPDLNTFPRSDGIISNKRGVLLVIRHADCVPIFLYDKRNNAIGLVHSGWKGTAKYIGLEALRKMMIEFGTNPKEVIVGLGPSAHNCCYTIESGWPHEVITSLPEWKKYIHKKEKGWQVDLSGFIKSMFWSLE
jgi:polyphenol oxidase